MKAQNQDFCPRYRCREWAILYMRLFAGGIMLFHNIGKIQNYNEIVNAYPAFDAISPAAVFVITSIIESLLASLIIIGLWVRMSAFILTVGIFFTMVWGKFGGFEQDFIWMGIYLFLVISGGGVYGFDRSSCSLNSQK